MESWHDEDDDEFGANENSEWKSHGKDALIFLIDSSPKMHLKHPNAVLGDLIIAMLTHGTFDF